jgi:zinc/manganese transport system substrate-binding protein
MGTTQKSKSNIWSVTGLAGLFVLFLLGLYGFAHTQTSAIRTNGTVQVVAGENFWGDIASQLGGQQVKVTSIITDPTADPHLYESNAHNAAAVSSTQVVIVNGLGYDEFMDKLLGVTKHTDRRVITVSHILGITDPGANEHVWYDLPRIHEVAAEITASFIALDPTHRNEYQRNLAAFTESLQPLLNTVEAIKERYPHASVAYTEPVPAYLLQASGLSIKTPESFAKAIEDGNEPNPADVTAMNRLITNKEIKVLLYNAQATSPATEHVKSLAKQVGIPIVGITETVPTTERSYQSWQQHQLNALLSALGSNKS